MTVWYLSFFPLTSITSITSFSILSLCWRLCFLVHWENRQNQRRVSSSYHPPISVSINGAFSPVMWVNELTVLLAEASFSFTFLPILSYIMTSLLDLFHFHALLSPSFDSVLCFQSRTTKTCWWTLGVMESDWRFGLNYRGRWSINFLKTVCWFLMDHRENPQSLESVQRPMVWFCFVSPSSLHSVFLTSSWFLEWAVLLNVSVQLHVPFSFFLKCPSSFVWKFSSRITFAMGLPWLPLGSSWSHAAFVVHIGGVQHSLHCLAIFFLICFPSRLWLAWGHHR